MDEIANEHEYLAEQFEANRAHLWGVAFRMLGSMSEADDAVQEGWLRLSRSDTSDVDNLGGWLTTVVARVCLDMLRSRRSRREEPLEALGPDEPHLPAAVMSLASDAAGTDPEQEALLADSVGLALLVVLETLAPAERLAFVLHDMVAMPFEEIAPIVGRTPTAARKLASRARLRVQGEGAAADPDAELGPPAPVSAGSSSLRYAQGRQFDHQRKIVDAFLAASRGGDFDALLALLDPDVVLRADRAAVAAGASGEVRGAEAVAGTFAGRARVAQPAVVNGAAGAVWAPGEQPRIAFSFGFRDGKIIEIDILADPEQLRLVDLALPGG